MVILYAVCVCFLICVFIRTILLRTLKQNQNVVIVVLGDIGRSPRMQYHAISLTKSGFDVDLIGYPGSAPLKELTDNPNLRIRYIRPPPDLRDKLPRILCYIVKVLWQTATLLCALFSRPISGSLILQNPPAVPTMPICWFYCLLTKAHFLIDWHNYAYTLMALSLHKEHILVKITKLIESTFGAKACNNICVTEAMKKDLLKNWDIKAQVLYDRPADKFHPISLDEKHEFLSRLSDIYDVFKGDRENCTKFTISLASGIQLSPSRPALIVSSTSWTEDEDFSILLNALDDYEDAFQIDGADLPDLYCVITGKGPLKEFYTSIIELRNWKHVIVCTPWLENDDYPKMLASADLGVCLHASSSGLDLPMKVVDMFGCNLPVCAYNFNCLSELVQHNKNSLVFSNEKELAKQLISWFQGFPNNMEQQIMDKRFREELEKFQKIRWHKNWSTNVLPCFKK